MDHGEEIGGKLVAAGGDAAEVLHLIEEPLNQFRSRMEARSEPFDTPKPSPQAAPMSEPWISITATLRRKQKAMEDGAFQAAFGGIEQLASFIAEGPLSSALFGWTSMYDLCVQQVDIPPYAGPYLRVSPLSSGLIEFRYIDTAVAERQWRRVVPPDAATTQLTTFLDQLRWVASAKPSVNGFAT